MPRKRWIHMCNAPSPYTLSPLRGASGLLGLIAPEMEADVEFAAFVQEPAEEGTEDGEHERACDRPGVVFDHKAGDDVAGNKKDRGVEKNGEDPQRQDIEWKGEKEQYWSYEGVEQPQHQSSHPAGRPIRKPNARQKKRSDDQRQRV